MNNFAPPLDMPLMHKVFWYQRNKEAIIRMNNAEGEGLDKKAQLSA